MQTRARAIRNALGERTHVMPLPHHASVPSSHPNPILPLSKAENRVNHLDTQCRVCANKSCLQQAVWKRLLSTWKRPSISIRWFRTQSFSQYSSQNDAKAHQQTFTHSCARVSKWLTWVHKAAGGFHIIHVTFWNSTWSHVVCICVGLQRDTIRSCSMTQTAATRKQTSRTNLWCLSSLTVAVATA